MKQTRLALVVLMILLAAGVWGVSAFTPGISGAGAISLAPDCCGQQGFLALPTWQQVNSNGFGDLDASEVSALGVFSGALYAGTSNTVDGARIFNSPDGQVWTAVIPPGFGIAHDIRPPAILDLIVFNGRLYASTGRGDGPAQIWRTVNGTSWAPMTITGFGDPDTVNITALAEYGGWIYAGASNLISGAQIWRSFSGDNNTWTKVGPAAPAPTGSRVTGFAVFGGALYAAIESAGPVQVWRSNNGTSWTTVMNNGFGNPNTIYAGGMDTLAGKLYLGAGNSVQGAQLWRTGDGTTWEKVNYADFSAVNNQQVEMVFVYGNQLYVSVKNGTTGLKLWRSADGTTWERANQDGFGDSHNSGTNWSNASANFVSQLYVGTTNILDGGELWRMAQSATPSPTPTRTPTPTPTPTPPFPPVAKPVYVPITLH